MSCRVASATANNVRTLGEKTKAHASTRKRDSTSSEKPAAAVFSVKAASKKQARVSMKKPSPATGSLGKRASALSKKPAPAVSSGKQDSAYLEKPAAADSRKRASTSSEKSSPVSKKKPNTNRISAILEVEEVQRQEVNPMLKLFYPGGAEAQKKI